MTEKTRLQFPADLQQQINILNGRVINANFAYGDLLREMDSTFKAMAATIIALQTENAELKAKTETPKTQ